MIKHWVEHAKSWWRFNLPSSFVLLIGCPVLGQNSKKNLLKKLSPGIKIVKILRSSYLGARYSDPHCGCKINLKWLFYFDNRLSLISSMLRNIISNHIHGTSLPRLYGSFKNDVTQSGWSLCEEFDNGGGRGSKISNCAWRHLLMPP